jgi:hypothetical protein
MKIEGIEIQIRAGDYRSITIDGEEHGYLHAEFVERGEITLTSGANKVPVMEIVDMAKKLALKIELNHIRRSEE